MSPDDQESVAQTEDRLNQLDKAVVERDVSAIEHHALELAGLLDVMGPTPMTDSQRQRMRAIATDIDKLDEIEVGPLKSVADGLRDLSKLGQS